MNLPKKPEGFSVIPKREHPCLWMMAGVIAYKLCERDYQCESCPLDIEMRHANGETRDSLKGYEGAEEKLTTIAPLFYGPNHTWVRLEGSSVKPRGQAHTFRVNGQTILLGVPVTAVVGLDDFILKLLLKVDRVVLPKPGTRVSLGDILATLIQDANAFEITSPISGKVTKLNEELSAAPQVMIEHPVEKSWLACFRPENLTAEIKDLLVGRKALAWQQNESRKLETLIGTLKGEDRERLGATMPDGKPASFASLLQIVGPERYRQIILSFLKREFD